MTNPTVMKVSQATLPLGSCLSTSSKTASEIWSQTLSGCPSVTDSDVKKKSLLFNFPPETENSAQALVTPYCKYSKCQLFSFTLPFFFTTCAFKIVCNTC